MTKFPRNAQVKLINFYNQESIRVMYLAGCGLIDGIPGLVYIYKKESQVVYDSILISKDQIVVKDQIGVPVFF